MLNWFFLIFSISGEFFADAKSEKIETLLAFIEERLKTLEEEKEDLKEYQKWDKMKRLFYFSRSVLELNASF